MYIYLTGSLSAGSILNGFCRLTEINRKPSDFEQTLF